MCKSMIEVNRPQITIWRKRIACWITKATNTFSINVILTTLPQQQWLHGRVSFYVTRTLPACLPCSLWIQRKSDIGFYCTQHLDSLANFNLISFNIQKKLSKEYKLWSSSSRNFLHPPLSFSLLGTNILIGTFLGGKAAGSRDWEHTYIHSRIYLQSPHTFVANASKVINLSSCQTPSICYLFPERQVKLHIHAELSEPKVHCSGTERRVNSNLQKQGCKDLHHQTGL